MFKRILVSTDFTAASNAIMPCATTMAQAFGSKMHLIHVMPPSAVREPERLGDFPPLLDFMKRDTEGDFLPPLKPEVPIAKAYLYDRSTPRMILEYGKEHKADLICLAATSQRVDLTWWSAGKTVEHIVSSAPCSVLCLRGRPIKEKDWKRPAFHHILLLAELDSQRDALIERVMPLVERFHSMFHVFPLQGRSTQSGEQVALRELCQIQNGKANVLLFSNPKNRMENLLTFVNETPVDLIVMTPRVRSAFSNPLLSDIFVRLLRLARCPILLLR